MTTLNKTTQSQVKGLARVGQRIPIVIRAIVSGFSVFAVGSVIAFNAIMALIPSPWSFFVMVGALWIYWKYFSGSWWPKSTAQIRRENARATKLSTGVWKWSLTAALLGVVVIEAMLVVTFRIVEFPADAFALGIDFSSFPIWQVWLFLILAASVAGITEEVGFRGYMQVPLEKRYGPVAGIMIVAVVFMVFHLNQAWAPFVVFQLVVVGLMWGVLAKASASLIPGIISHIVADIINFAYWWTDVAGTFDYRPIAETGIDGHFIVWVLIFVASVALFIVAARRTLSARRQM